MNGVPLVDINIAVYNHEAYLRQTIESVLSQQTTFPFRLLIGDDCSTDGSIAILKEFEQKYPEQIKVIYQKKNLGLQSSERNGIVLLNNSTAKYIALLDGDDYWSDTHKLQKQIEFLELNPDYAICFHGVNEMGLDKQLQLSQLAPEPRTYTIDDLAVSWNFIHTVSVVFRNTFGKLPDWFGQSPAADYTLHMLNASTGKIYYMPEPMGVYRKFVGIWGTKTDLSKYINWCKTLALLIKHFDDEKILTPLRKQHAHWLLYIYENNAVDAVQEQEPLVKEILDRVIITSPDQMARFKTKFLFLSLYKKLILSLRHNPIGNKLMAPGIKGDK